MRARRVATVLVLALLAACAPDPDSPTTGEAAPSSGPADPGADGSSPDPSASPSARARTKGTRVIAAESDFGTVLFDSSGQAIYIFDVETTTEPRCYDECADAWPPVLTDAAPAAGDRVQQALLGTVRRSDGTTQVTYGGHPLYFYAHEDKHEVKCHDVFLNGGNWYAVQPDGDRAP